METRIQRPALTAKTMRKHFKAWAGFTLIELMVVVAIIAIIGVFAVPGFVSFIENNRINTQSSEFVTSLALARIEAVKRGGRVVVCPGTTAAGCGGIAWEDGWIVFADILESDPINFVEVADGSGDVALEVHDALAGSNLLRGTTAVRNMISFMPDGRADEVTAAEGAFTLCLPAPATLDNRSRIISITTIGRTRIALGDATGRPVTACQ